MLSNHLLLLLIAALNWKCLSSASHLVHAFFARAHSEHVFCPSPYEITRRMMMVMRMSRLAIPIPYLPPFKCVWSSNAEGVSPTACPCFLVLEMKSTFPVLPQFSYCIENNLLHFSEVNSTTKDLRGLQMGVSNNTWMVPFIALYSSQAAWQETLKSSLSVRRSRSGLFRAHHCSPRF